MYTLNLEKSISLSAYLKILLTKTMQYISCNSYQRTDKIRNTYPTPAKYHYQSYEENMPVFCTKLLTLFNMLVNLLFVTTIIII